MEKITIHKYTGNEPPENVWDGLTPPGRTVSIAERDCREEIIWK
jgi:hypothetical protein